MNLTPDAQVILLLCSKLSLPEEADLKPLTLSEWNALVRTIVNSTLRTPGQLLGLSTKDLQKELEMSNEEAERLARLLDRGGGLAIELERLESLGIWVVTRAGASYPQRFRERLQNSSPPVLFGAGERDLLGQPGLAVVGSRHIDEKGKKAAELIGMACGREGLVLYSGGARGADSMASNAALKARGTAVSILADSLEKTIRSPDVRPVLMKGDLALVTPYSPGAGFSVGAAMGRNKLIYALADYALVVASDAGQGGTWAGATEALKARWLPVFVLEGPDMPEGNHQLLHKGAIPFPYTMLETPISLGNWLQANSDQLPERPQQGRLF